MEFVPLLQPRWHWCRGCREVSSGDCGVHGPTVFTVGETITVGEIVEIDSVIIPIGQPDENL